jgi:cation diffusion facilitator family transporter
MNQSIQIQKFLFLLALVQFAIKITAWYFTNSIAILTDALESIVNIIGSLTGLVGMYIAAKPKDKNHPYGHGKTEYLSSSFEGILIGITGLIIIYESIVNIKHQHPIGKLDIGLALVAVSALVNYLAGVFAEKKGIQLNSLQLVATGKHLLTDAYSTIGLFLGLLLLYFTKITMIDSIVAVVFAVILIVTSYKIMKESLAGILDEADDELLTKVIAHLEKNRSPNWIDLHNLRIIKYGNLLHFDCHLTVPWYLNVHEAHQEVEDLHNLVKVKFGESIELFSHTDGCLPFSCEICQKRECIKREKEFVKRINWTIDNLKDNAKHRI